MPFTFTPIDRAVYEKTVARNSHRASEPRDTIHRDIVLAFLDANIEVAGNGTDENGNGIGYTWADVLSNWPDVADMIAEKDKPQSIATIQSTINQTANRDKWNVYCRAVKNAGGSVGFLLVNETLEKASIKAAVEAKMAAAAAAKAAEEAAAKAEKDAA